MLLIHVDDFAAAGSDRKELNAFRDSLHNEFGIKDMGPLTKFIHYQIIRDRQKKTVILHQNDFIVDLLDSANMSNCSPTKTPGDLYLSLSQKDCPKTEEDIEEMKLFPYREIIGGLSHLATHTRPDIVHHVSSLSRFNSNPGQKHKLAVKQLLRYLKATPTFGLSS